MMQRKKSDRWRLNEDAKTTEAILVHHRILRDCALPNRLLHAITPPKDKAMTLIFASLAIGAIGYLLGELGRADK